MKGRPTSNSFRNGQTVDQGRLVELYILEEFFETGHSCEQMDVRVVIVQLVVDVLSLILRELLA